MIRTVKFDLAKIVPSSSAILKSQGISEEKKILGKVHDLTTQALELISSHAVPKGMTKEISIAQFEEVFTGEGENAENTPLEPIIPQAERLALFAFTLGGEISTKIEILFGSNDFALAYILDCVASLTAENAVEVLETDYFKFLEAEEVTSVRVLAYSPGYCGWHVSAQRKLFEYLEPEKIGISLNDCCLMIPLKSVTGVLVAGKGKIHQFKPNYSFCGECKDRSCLRRMKNSSIA